LQVLSTALLCLVPARHSWLLAVAVISVYQLTLSVLGLNEYILHADAPRAGFIDANREGIFSCCGYLALYLAGVQLGHMLLRQR